VLLVLVLQHLANAVIYNQFSHISADSESCFLCSLYFVRFGSSVTTIHTSVSVDL